MFSKILASVGIGSAKVDTVLMTDLLQPGGRVDVEIRAKGGNVEQRINGITLEVMTQAQSESDDGEIARENIRLQSFYISDAFTLAPGEEWVMPTSFTLGAETPITALGGDCQVWIKTEMDIDLAIDPGDKDYLLVHPTSIIQHFINALTENGFNIAKIDVEKGYLNGNGFSSQSGCYQEIEFKPTGLGVFGSIQEVEMSFITEENQTHVLIELDRRFRGDGYASLSVNNQASYDQIETALKQLAGI